MKKIAVALMCAIMLLPGCGTMSNTGKGSIVGTGAGATIGAIIGALISKDGKGAAIGAAAGAAVGGGTGAIIGHVMDKKAKELAELEGTNVEVVDINGFKGIKVTFKDGILFDFNKSNVSETAKAELKEFAAAHDVVVFVAGRDSSNGKVLYQWCRSVNPRTYFISSPQELDPQWFASAAAAGVCGATSTPKWLLDKVAEAIKICNNSSL